MAATPLTDGVKPEDDVHASRLSGFVDGKPIRVIDDDWLMSISR